MEESGEVTVEISEPVPVVEETATQTNVEPTAPASDEATAPEASASDDNDAQTNNDEVSTEIPLSLEQDAAVPMASSDTPVAAEEPVQLEISGESVQLETEDSVQLETSEAPVQPAEQVPAEPEESPEEKAKKEQERMDAMTSYIDSVDEISFSLKDEKHPQLERPEVKAPTRRKRTNNTKTFAQLEEEERKRQEEALKPRENVDQTFNDPLGLLQKPAQRSTSIAQEAQNVHAAFMQKAKERKAKEEAEKKAKEQAIQEEEANSRSSVRISIGGKPKARPASARGPPKVEANETIQVDLNAVEEKAPWTPQKIMDKLQSQGCCTIS